MYFKTNSLKREIAKWKVFELLNARRLAETRKTRLLNILPRPQEVEITGLLPDWNLLPLHSPLPYPEGAPPGRIGFTRGTLGENVMRLCNTFDLGDPYRHDLRIEYEGIHDRHLQHYLMAPHIKQYIESLGIITDENKVNCDLKSYNAYRHYIWSAHRSGIKKELLNLEAQNISKITFRRMMESAKTVRKTFQQVRSVKKQMLRRRIKTLSKKVYARVMRHYLFAKSQEATRRVATAKNDNWIIHLVKERDYPKKRSAYIFRSYDRRSNRSVHFVLKWRNHFVWEEERKEIKKKCQILKNILRYLRWAKRIRGQTLLLKRDFLIQNDYLQFSAKRKRIREFRYKLDRLAMGAKYCRIRYKRKFKNLEEWWKKKKIDIAADFLINPKKHPPLVPKGWEIKDESEGYNKQVMVRKHKHQMEKRGLWPLPRVRTRKRIGRITHVSLLKGKLHVSRLARRVIHETMFQYARNFTYNMALSYSGAQVYKLRKYLICLINRIRHNKDLQLPKWEDHYKRYETVRKLPFKMVAENQPPEAVIKHKLKFAIRRFMKHERRRKRITKQQPEWSYYDKYPAKYKQESLVVPSKWRDLNFYFPLIREQFEIRDWDKHCNSLGKYLLYTLIHTQSFGGKRRIINSVLTKYRASVFKLKNKVKMIMDLIKRITLKKIMTYYPNQMDKCNTYTLRRNIRKLFSKDRKCGGDKYIKGITYMVSFMNLYQLNIQLIGPFADTLMLSVCFAKKFPMRFKKYRIDKYKARKLYFNTVYPFRPKPWRDALYNLKIRQLKHLKGIHKRDPDFVFQRLSREMEYTKYHPFYSKKRNKKTVKIVEFS